MRSRQPSLSSHVLPVLALVTFASACAGGTPQTEPAPDPAPEAEPAPEPGAQPSTDPRVGLEPGFQDAGTAASNLELVAQRERPEAFIDPADLGNILYANSDMAYQEDLLFLGNFRGFQVWDIGQPSAPELRTAVLCPGGQGDVSVHGNLLFMSVEMTNARIDCGAQGTLQEAVDPERFRGVRVFDISDLDAPRQVAAVQTCRGSHTHTLVPHEEDPEHVYVYVQGTSSVRPAAELEGCVEAPPEEDPGTALFRIEVIRVPVDRPEDAEIVSMPRIFQDPETGDIAGLWPGGAAGEEAQQTATTDQCHDITAFPDIGLAGGACSGNGILLDISDPVNPVRVDEVFDPNFAYWHSATFDNEGTKVIFTDEWGGGLAPRCQASDPPRWGANAIFTLEDREMELEGYYKLPAPQSALENCVAHNGSLVPVPGRDIMVQSWYQGGISVFDFTDPDNPFEIAFFDRGPLDAEEPLLGGSWSAYWYNGRIYSSEIARGLDVLRLLPSEHLSANEIAAAEQVRQERFNPQTQQRITWPADPVVARALLDQLRRGDAVPDALIDRITEGLDRAESAGLPGASDLLAELAGAAEAGRNEATGQTARRLELLAETLRGM